MTPEAGSAAAAKARPIWASATPLSALRENGGGPPVASRLWTGCWDRGMLTNQEGQWVAQGRDRLSSAISGTQAQRGTGTPLSCRPNRARCAQSSTEQLSTRGGGSRPPPRPPPLRPPSPSRSDWSKFCSAPSANKKFSGGGDWTPHTHLKCNSRCAADRHEHRCVALLKWGVVLGLLVAESDIGRCSCTGQALFIRGVGPSHAAKWKVNPDPAKSDGLKWASTTTTHKAGAHHREGAVRMPHLHGGAATSLPVPQTFTFWLFVKR